MAGLGNCAQPLRQHMHRHIVWGIKKAGIIFNCLRMQRFDTRPRCQRGPWFIETNVSVGANAQQLDIHSPGLLDRLIIGASCITGIVSATIRAVHLVVVEIHMLGKLPANGSIVALLVITGQSHVLVKEEHRATRKAQVFFLVTTNQLAVQRHRC